MSYYVTPVAHPDTPTTTFTGRLLDRLQPWMNPAHEVYATALAAMFEQIASIVHDQGVDGEPGYVPGWGVLFDPDLCPTPFLPYLGQYVGVGNLVGIPDATARALIKSQPRHRRGTPRSIVDSAAATLTGTQTVTLIERYLGDPYQIQVITFAAETPSQSQTLTAMLANKPAGILLTYDVLAGQQWTTVAGSGTWGALATSGSTWADVRDAL